MLTQDPALAARTEGPVVVTDELPDRMAEVVEREGLPARGPGGPGHGHFGAGLDAAAEAIGIESEELRTALRDGSTIAEVAERIEAMVNGELRGGPGGPPPADDDTEDSSTAA